jgi:hypothetical protein
MSTTQHQQRQPQPQQRKVASDEHVGVFVEVIEHDGRICNNCFGRRAREHDHFRSSGGTATGRNTQNDQTADQFCTVCHAGTGKNTLYRPHDGGWDDDAEAYTTDSGRPPVDYSNVQCELGPRYISDMGGTVERDWGRDSPLPKNGEMVSLFQNLARLRDRLDELGYEVDWGRWKRCANAWKDAKPTCDRPIFARLVTTTIED